MGTTLGIALGIGFGGARVYTPEEKLWKAYSDSSLTVVPASDTSITLTWTNPVVQGNTLRDVIVERSTDNVTFATVATLGAVETYTDTELTANTLYYYRLKFVSSRGIVTGAGAVAIDYPYFIAEPTEYDDNPLGGIITMSRAVLHVGGTYHLFEEETGTDPNWLIRKRTSKDGLHWTNKSAALLLKGGAGTFDGKGQADPSVIRESATDWRMWFDALSSASIWDKIGYATSEDGDNWTKYGEVLSRGAAGAWDGAWVHHPSCVKHNGLYYMYYGGSRNTNTNYNIGLATSVDGINWEKDINNPIIEYGSAGQWDSAYVRPSSNIININGVWYMYYWGYNGTYFSIGLATSLDMRNWKKRGLIYTTAGAEGPSANGAIYAEGGNSVDKCVKIWFTKEPSRSFCFLKLTLKDDNSVVKLFKPDSVLEYGDTGVSSTQSIRAANYIYLYRISASQTEAVDTIRLFIGTSIAKSLTGTIKAAIYSNNVNTPQYLLVESVQTDWVYMHRGRWNDLELNAPLNVTEGVDYWIALWSTHSFSSQLQAGGSANHGNLSLAYGNFPNPITATTNQAFNKTGLSLYKKNINVYNISVATEPNNVYFNTAIGNKVMSKELVNSEYAWYYDAGILYVYSEDHPDIRYYVTYN